MFLGPMVPAERQRVPISEAEHLCGCGRREMSSSGNWKRCSVCRREQTRVYSADDRARAAAMRQVTEALVRPDGWCWMFGYRGARLQELERQLGHTKWIGPVAAESRS